jgi:competence protein ComEA
MEHFSFKPFKEWFGFTRRERRASFILLILILSVAGLRYIIPSGNITIEEVPLEIRDTIYKYLSVKSVSVAGSYPRGSRAKQQKPLFDINKCDSTSLEALPGIGPVLASRIVKFRNLLGGFAYVDQLREVYGLPEETYNMISGRLFADSSAVRKINVNSADYRELSRLPYFERYEVTAILKYREINGSISGVSDLIDNKLIAPEKVRKVRPYLEFGD